MQSIRHDRVQAVSSSQGWILGKIMIDLGSRVLVIDNCQKATVSVISELANKWYHQHQRNETVQPIVKDSSADPLIEKLEKLAGLYTMGALTEEEFKIAKGKVLSAM